MILFIILIILSFLWLAYETEWFTIRLPYGKPLKELWVDGLINLMVAMVIGVNLIPQKRLPPRDSKGRFAKITIVEGEMGSGMAIL